MSRTLKLCLLGDNNNGKSTLGHNLSQLTFLKLTNSTDSELSLSIEIALFNRYAARPNLRNKSICIVVDPSDLASIRNIPQWAAEFAHYSQNSTLSLVISKTDLATNDDITPEVRKEIDHNIKGLLQYEGNFFTGVYCIDKIDQSLQYFLSSLLENQQANTQSTLSELAPLKYDFREITDQTALRIAGRLPPPTPSLFAEPAPIPTIEYTATIPDEYLDPYTQNIMLDPVVAQDGNSYDRTTAEEHREEANFQPFLPNHNLQRTIQKWRGEHERRVLPTKPKSPEKESFWNCTLHIVTPENTGRLAGVI
jgi:GTPase SAR1 family protein